MLWEIAFRPHQDDWNFGTIAGQLRNPFFFDAHETFSIVETEADEGNIGTLMKYRPAIRKQKFQRLSISKLLKVSSRKLIHAYIQFYLAYQRSDYGHSGVFRGIGPCPHLIFAIGKNWKT